MKEKLSLPKGWELKTIGDVCVSASSNVSQNKLNDDEGDYPIFGASGLIKKVSFYHRDKPYLSIVKDGSGVGRVTKMDAYTSVIGTLQYILPKENIDLDYLNYSLMSVDFKKYVAGAAIPHIYFKDYKNEPFLWMPLPEQQRIVSILDEAFSAIERSRNNAEQNLKNAKELFESYLQGVFDPSTRSGQGKGDGWEEKKLGEVFEIKPPKKEAKAKLSDNDLVSFLPMEDLGVCENEIKPEKEKPLKDVAGSYTYFAENDVLLAKITPCFENGKLGVAKNLTNGIGFGSSEYIVFRSNGDIEPEFLFYFLSRNSFREEGRKFMSGAVGHKRVSKDWIENYLFSFPKSKEAQQTIVRQLDALRAETQKLEAVYQKKLANLEELKKSILQKAFAGELTIDNV